MLMSEGQVGYLASIINTLVLLWEQSPNTGAFLKTGLPRINFWIVSYINGIQLLIANKEFIFDLFAQYFSKKGDIAAIIYYRI